MPGFEIWSLVKIPFPYTDRPVQQQRPALVVARYDKMGAPILLWVLMITSAEHRRWPGDIDVSDPQAAGLPAGSMVRCPKIATVQEREVGATGSLASADRKLVRGALLDRIGISLP